MIDSADPDYNAPLAAISSSSTLLGFLDQAYM